MWKSPVATRVRVMLQGAPMAHEAGAARSTKKLLPQAAWLQSPALETRDGAEALMSSVTATEVAAWLVLPQPATATMAQAKAHAGRSVEGSAWKGRRLNLPIHLA